MTRQTIWTAVALLGAAIILPTGLTAQDNCELRGKKVLTERAGESLRLEAGAGKLVITGKSGIDHVRVDATLCASDQERMDALNVSLDGGTIDTDYPRNGASGWFGRNRYARIDLVVQVPAGTNLRVDDSSGSIEVGAVGDTVRIDGGGSGSVTVRDVDGDLVVTDTRRSRIRFSDIRGVLDLPTEKRKGSGR